MTPTLVPAINPRDFGLNLMVMGHGRHGKGTFGDIARNEFGLISLGSSRYACDTFMFDQLKDEYGYQSADECFADRHRSDAMRELWYKGIFGYNTPDRTRLGRGIFEQATIYDGIRDDQEFYALKQAGAFDLAIWIDASDRMPPEPEGSIKVSANDADIILTNNGTPEAYAEKVRRLLLVMIGAATR